MCSIINSECHSLPWPFFKIYCSDVTSFYCQSRSLEELSWPFVLSITKPGRFSWQSAVLWVKVMAVAMMWQKARQTVLSKMRWLKKNIYLLLWPAVWAPQHWSPIGKSVPSCASSFSLFRLISSCEADFSRSPLTETLRDNYVLCYESYMALAIFSWSYMGYS